ncbi:MAG: 3-deoxy-D-manno-octulosonate 8-phosphate phosphatase, partial [Muribaculaceae bacterium]|nr:3-deoxy-D-manno-octulosonate 8-phosphate phosphatase [Muribaculaceae bacterium]
EGLTYVGLPVAPADASTDIKNAARYITTANGGYGEARELIEEILRDRGEWMSKAKAFGW